MMMVWWVSAQVIYILKWFFPPRLVLAIFEIFSINTLKPKNFCGEVKSILSQLNWRESFIYSVLFLGFE